MSMWKPLGKFVLVQADEATGSEVRGSLVVVETWPMATALVFDVGPEVLGVRVGDKVTFDRGVGRPIDGDGAHFLLVNEAQLMARC